MARMSQPLPAFETIELRVEESIAVLTLNRPRVRNAIDEHMRAELRTALQLIAPDPSIRGLVAALGARHQRLD